MSIIADDLAKWETDDPNLTIDEISLELAIHAIETELEVKLPEEYRSYLHLVTDQSCGAKQEEEYFLIRYDSGNEVALMPILSRSQRVISSTKLLQESIYEHRSLLPNGLIAIGSDYDDFSDAYLIYDVRPNSSTYQNIFHWRYYKDNLVSGEGLGLVAHSLKEFLHTPTSEDKL